MSLDYFTRKIAYVYLQYLLRKYEKAAIRICEANQRISKPEKVKSIAAVWYWPQDYPAASFTRLGKWKSYFESEGIQFDNFHVGTMDEVVSEYEGQSWTKRYLFYAKILKQRFEQFNQLKNYDVIWVDRWFLPYYPSENAFWEKQLKKMTGYLIMDSTDGTDYEGNPDLIMDIFKQADRITVAFEGLYNFYQPIFGEKVVRFNYTIIDDAYIVKDNWQMDEKPVIGWMGSPSNFEYVKSIESALKEVATEIPFKFVIICRQDVAVNIPGAEIEYHRYGDDYEKLIASFDIGIAPFTEKSFSNTGKIGMKHQEFLLCQVPQVCSPQGISEHAEHRKHCLIADELDQWTTQIKELLSNVDLRTELATNGRKLCLEHYTFDGQWPRAHKALTNFDG